MSTIAACVVDRAVQAKQVCSDIEQQYSWIKAVAESPVRPKLAVKGLPRDGSSGAPLSAREATSVEERVVVPARMYQCAHGAVPWRRADRRGVCSLFFAASAAARTPPSNSKRMHSIRHSPVPSSGAKIAPVPIGVEVCTVPSPA